MPPQLTILAEPKLQDATLLLALSGWMDGGDVSTGSLRHILEQREVKQIARIEPDDFYIYNFPGPMELAALFRPHVRYEGGLVKEFSLPADVFLVDESANLVFFVGKEPNLKWREFAECIFSLAKSVGVSRIIFIGSFGGAVPHTREPRLYGSISSPKMRGMLKQHRLRPTQYEGPGSFATFLLIEAKRHSVEMLSLVAEIPSYLQGRNPLSIEAVARRLAAILNQPIDVASLRNVSNEWESEVSALVEKDPDLAETIRKLEDEYDSDLVNFQAEES